MSMSNADRQKFAEYLAGDKCFVAYAHAEERQAVLVAHMRHVSPQRMAEMLVALRVQITHQFDVMMSSLHGSQPLGHEEAGKIMDELAALAKITPGDMDMRLRQAKRESEG